MAVKMVRRPRDTALLYAETRLGAWSKWAREFRAGLGYPTVSLLYKAMRQKSIRIKSLDVKIGREDGPEYTAQGTETRSMIPSVVPEPPEAIMEVDRVVAELPERLHEIIIADFFTYGPIELRCRKTRWRLARYSQLLEAAKYAVFSALMVGPSRNDFDSTSHLLEGKSAHTGRVGETC